MKRISPSLLIICLIIVMLCACHRSYRSDLERIDSCLSVVPPDTVEAQRLLDSMGASVGSFSEADRRYYIMLWEDLQGKRFAPLAGDSQVRAMVSCYDRHGSANERMRTEKCKGLTPFWTNLLTGMGILFVMFLAAWGGRRSRMRRKRKE